MLNLVKKLFSVSVNKLSPSVKSFLQTRLTDLMDFLEKHFNNIIRHIFGVGGAGLLIGEILNINDTIQDGAVEKFGYFSRLLSIDSVFSSLNSSISPYMSNFNCSFLQLFASLGGIDAINTIINSCAYALLFWLAVVVFKYTIGLLPVLLRVLA